MSGLFNLNDPNLEGVLGLQLEMESTEFEAGKQTNGGNTEKGSNVPGGLTEKPSGKPYDETPIKIPAGTTITAEQYNKALDTLQKSFKEGAEMLDALRKVNVVQESVDTLQQRYVEDALDEALLEAYENGPIFESVNKEDKKDIKAIVKTLRSKIPEMLKDTDIKFKPAKTFLRLFLNMSSNPTKSTGNASNRTETEITWWTTRFWQVLGVIYCEGDNIKEVINKLNTELDEDLGKYKILYFQSVPGLLDLWSLKFGWKNIKNVYFLIVDKKVPSELKEIQQDMVDAIEDDNDKDKEDKEKTKPNSKK